MWGPIGAVRHAAVTDVASDAGEAESGRRKRSSMTQTGNEEVWRAVFAEGHPKLKQFQRFHMRLPSPPRCKMCFVPFGGIGGVFMRWRGKGPSQRNPRFCNACDAFITAFPGGAEVDLSILFVDVRNSVGLAERLGPTAFSSIMRDFYTAATQPLIDTDGFVIEFIGDAVAGIYPPGFCGPEHARKAIAGAERLVRGKMPSAPDGTELPIGVGVHTGTVFIGTVAGAEGGYHDVQPLGDNVNVAARLSGMAAPTQALISEATLVAAGCNPAGLQTRQLDLKGRTAPITAYAIGRDSAPLAA
jgi:adenylate cyclase